MTALGLGKYRFELHKTNCLREFFCGLPSNIENTYFLPLVRCDFDRASSLISGNKVPTRCNRGFYCRSYCLLNMFRAPLCPSSGAQEYYTVVFQVAGLVWSWGLCVRFAGCCLSSWWWAWWCPKHVEQAIRSAIKTSVASSWHFISTYFYH